MADAEHATRMARRFSKGSLVSGLRGIEKESLRVRADATLAQTPHPAQLGSALTHPYITTDYSEALLELITPPVPSAEAALSSLDELHLATHTALEHELLWAASMSCCLRGDASVPIAWYGTSNVGTRRHVYRRGLGYRYGRLMQAIAGVHYNFSFSDSFWREYAEQMNDARPLLQVRSDGYFKLIRNFQRFVWLFIYLFGASPAVCKSFLTEPSGFASFDDDTHFLPYATSLRMSDIGYRNQMQERIRIDYDGLNGFIRSMAQAINTSDPRFRAIGLFEDGQYRQLSPNVLQLEAEYYSLIRPKTITQGSETPLMGLKARGVEYVEVRALDLDPFSTVGVSRPQILFLEVLLNYCLFAASPPIGADEEREITLNQITVAREGRRLGVKLTLSGQPLSLSDWGHQLLQQMGPIAEAMDQGLPESPYARAVQAQHAVLEHPQSTPSAQILNQMRVRGEGFAEFTLRLSREHKAHHQSRSLPAAKLEEFGYLARSSWVLQAEMEGQERQAFSEYLQSYLAQYQFEQETKGEPTGLNT